MFLQVPKSVPFKTVLIMSNLQSVPDKSEGTTVTRPWSLHAHPRRCGWTQADCALPRGLGEGRPQLNGEMGIHENE